MKDILKFKTTLKCNGCLQQVIPYLNAAKGIEAWHIDMDSPDKLLTVTTKDALAADIIQKVEESGFTATQIDV